MCDDTAQRDDVLNELRYELGLDSTQKFEHLLYTQRPEVHT